MVSTSEADWTESTSARPRTSPRQPRGPPRARGTPARSAPTRAVTSTGARLKELGDLLVDLESQIIAEAQQRTWEQCRHHWRRRALLVPGEDAWPPTPSSSSVRSNKNQQNQNLPFPPTFEKKFDATRRPTDHLKPHTPHPHPRTRADLEASLLIDAQHELDRHPPQALGPTVQGPRGTRREPRGRSPKSDPRECGGSTKRCPRTRSWRSDCSEA